MLPYLSSLTNIPCAWLFLLRRLSFNSCAPALLHVLQQLCSSIITCTSTAALLQYPSTTVLLQYPSTAVLLHNYFNNSCAPSISLNCFVFAIWFFHCASASPSTVVGLQYPLTAVLLHYSFNSSNPVLSFCSCAPVYPSIAFPFLLILSFIWCIMYL